MVDKSMKHNIQLSEVITIDTQENRCALAFAMQLQRHLPSSPHTLFLTANKPELVRDNLEVVQRYFDHFNRIHANTTYLFLKEHWSEMQERYGTQAFINELRSLVEEEAYELFYFHRIDLFFDKLFTPEIEESVIALIEAVRYHHKKIFFSYNTKTVSGKSFDTLLQNRRDLSFDVVPNDDGECDLTMKTHNRLLQKARTTILLISDQADTRYMHNTIFAKEPKIDFRIITLEALQNDPGRHIDPETDLILYNDNRKLLDAEMSAAFKSFAPYAQIFWLTNRKSIRKTDLTESKKIGIDMLFAKYFDIKEYVYYVEQVIQNQFYSHKLDNLSFADKKQVVDIRELLQRVEELEKKHILFSIVTVRKSDIREENIASLIRKEDFVFMDDKHDIVLFVLLNLMPENAKQIIADRVDVNKLMVRHHSVENLAKLLH